MPSPAAQPTLPLWMRGLFDGSRAGLRRLTILLYLAVGPAFSAVLLVLGNTHQHPAYFGAVLALISAGFALLVWKREPQRADWILAVAIAPTVCCGLAFSACGAQGSAFLAVLGAPLAWCAVLFEWRVGAVAWVTACATCFAVVAQQRGLAAGAFNTLLFGNIFGLVAWVLQGMAGTLRRTARRKKALLDAMPDTVLRVDAGGNSKDVAYSPWEAPAAGEPGLEILSQAGLERVRTAIALALSSGEVQTLDYRASAGTALRDYELRIAPGGEQEAIVIRRDVTVQRRQERELQESQVRLALALQGSADAIFDQDLVTRAVYRSPRYAEMLGYAPGELGTAEADWALLLHPEDRPRTREAVEAVLAGREPHLDLEYRLRRKDGGWLWVRARARITARDGAGRPLRLTGTLSDTDAAHLAQERRLQEARLRGLENRINEIELVMRPDGTIVEANDRAVEAYGWTREELRRMNIRELRAPPALEPLAAQLGAAVSEESLRFHTEHKRRSGARFPVEVSSRTFKVGEETFLHSLIRDVSEQRAADLSMRRLAAAVEQAPVSVVITDAEGVIEYVNPAFERITGYARAEVLGKTPRLLGSGTHDRALFRDLWTTVRAGKTWTGRLVNKDKHGKLFTEDTVIAPVRDEHGTVRNLVAVKRDVSRELALQQELAQAHKLESIGRLAGGIAHDFNNILAVILLDVQALQAEEGHDPQLAAELAREIGDAATRAADLTRQLLAFARKQVIAPVVLDLNAALGKSEKLLRRLLGEDIALESRLHPGLWPVRCDPSQLEQVVLNLAVNARDAMPRGGRLTLATAPLPASDEAALAREALPRGDYVKLTVTDSGAGMPPEVLARIFEPFFTTKAVGKGTGLGLATVHGIVKQSDGSIRCESAPGQGTTFTVCLPRSREEAPRPVRSSSTGRMRRGGETVLLVEDDPHVRLASVRVLEAGGYRVRTANDGLAALDLLGRSPASTPDLVITDVVMPGLDGGGLLGELRSRHPALPTLVVSGYTDEAITEHGVRLDGVDYLPKPFSSADLLSRVRQLLDERGQPAATTPAQT